MLNLVSGVYGKWFGYWLTDLGADVHEIEVPWNEAIDAGSVAAYLDAHPDITVCSVVHSETPSGTLNPIEAIGPICRERGVVTIVDCVSSLGGVELQADEWQLDLLVAGPQKCLGGPVAMSLVAISPQAWAAIDANPTAPRDSFVSLIDWRDAWHGRGHFPVTPSVPDVHGVRRPPSCCSPKGSMPPVPATNASPVPAVQVSGPWVCVSGRRRMTSVAPPGHPSPSRTG